MASILWATFSNPLLLYRNCVIIVIIRISLNCIPHCPINNKPALVQIMACCLNLWWPDDSQMYTCVIRPRWLRESIGHRWIPLTKVTSVQLWCCLRCKLEKVDEQNIILPVIWHAMTLIWRDRNDIEWSSWEPVNNRETERLPTSQLRI